MRRVPTKITSSGILRGLGFNQITIQKQNCRIDINSQARAFEPGSKITPVTVPSAPGKQKFSQRALQVTGTHFSCHTLRIVINPNSFPTTLRSHLQGHQQNIHYPKFSQTTNSAFLVGIPIDPPLTHSHKRTLHDSLRCLPSICDRNSPRSRPSRKPCMPGPSSRISNRASSRATLVVCASAASAIRIATLS